MNSSRSTKWVAWLIFCAISCVPGLSIGASDEIVSVREFRTLARDLAGEGRQVRVRGVVLCRDAGWHQLYIHDGQETGYFSPDEFTAEPEVGQFVEIKGLTRGDGILTNGSLTILGLTNLPGAKRLAIADLASDHGEWVETTGRVLSADASLGRLALLLNEKKENCMVYVLGGMVTNDFHRLLDSKVRVRGINASQASGGKLMSGTIFAPGFEEIAVVEPSGGKSASLPVESISSLLNRELGTWTNNRVHINGLVVSYQRGQSIVVKDPTGVIRARIIQMTPIQTDERVDVWGFLQVAEEESILNSAYFEAARVDARAEDSVAGSASPGADVAKTGVITDVADVLKLKREEAAQHLPVRLRGVLTYADPDWRNAFLQNGSAAIYAALNSNIGAVASGQWVELIGTTGPGGFAPEVLSSEIRVLGTTNLPAPVKVDLQDLANGRLDAHWVEMEGVVRRVEGESSHVTLSLMTPEGRFKAIVPGFENKPPPMHLIDALVRVQGACISEINVRRQLSGITLRVPGMEQVRILEPAPVDPFSIGTTRIEDVATFDPDRVTGRRIKIRGVVTLRLPGQGFILQDASGGMRVLTRQTNAVSIGEAVEAIGFHAIGDYSPYMEEAVFRDAGSGSLPPPRKTTAEEVLLHGASDSQVVQVRGQLLQSVPRSANPQLVLQDGAIIFTAQLVNQGRRKEVPALQSGSVLRLTGVCAIQGGERHEPEAFRLLLREPADIEVIETPSWWTARHALMVAEGMMLAIAAALAWVVLLRRQVRTQTKLVRQKLEDEAALEERYRELFENANDMVYTHDLGGKLTSINQTGERLLHRARKEMLFRSLVDFVVEEEKVAARKWMESVVRGSAPATAEWDFETAAGQRVKLEISTRLIEQGGQLVEVEGIARDITERKRLEREILEASNREQRRIGHDLHDGVCQQLAGIAYMTSTLADELEEHGSAGAARAEKISGLINAVINQTRGVARGLFPVRLEENGLVSALEECAANASEFFKINCQFVSDDPPKGIENAEALHLYYIAIEAVANAAKHGKARNVTISLEPAGEQYSLRVRDDGAGFETSMDPQTGMGIRIMQYRARVIGASLTLQSTPGSGTEVACMFLPAPGETRNGAKVNGHAARANGGE